MLGLRVVRSAGCGQAPGPAPAATVTLPSARVRTVGTSVPQVLLATTLRLAVPATLGVPLMVTTPVVLLYAALRPDGRLVTVTLVAGLTENVPV